jgi:phage-related minor tail protein
MELMGTLGLDVSGFMSGKDAAKGAMTEMSAAAVQTGEDLGKMGGDQLKAVEAAFVSLGIKSSAELKKIAMDAFDNYQVIAQSGIASASDIERAAKASSESRIAYEKAVGAAAEEVAEQSKQSMAGLASSLTSVGAVMTAAVTGPLLAMGAAALKSGTDIDGAFDTIRIRTGQVSEGVGGLQESFRNVFGNVASNAADVSEAIATLNVRTGQTGPPLEALATQFLNISRLTGENLSSAIANATRLFGDWGIEVGKQSETMDFLFRVTQSSGIQFDKLASTLVTVGAPMRQLGFSMEETAIMVAKFEKEGVNAELVLGAMKAALAKFGKAGDEPKEAFARVTEAIKENSVEVGNNIAVQLVGARRAADFAAAVREGRLDLEKMTEAVKGNKDTINGAAKDTDDFAESWAKFKNQLTLALEPLGKTLVEMLNNLMPLFKTVIGIVGDFAQTFNDLPGPVKQASIVAAAAIGAGGPLMLAMGKLMGELPGLGKSLDGIGLSLKGIGQAGIIAAGAIAGIQLFEALRNNAKANSDLNNSTIELEKSARSLEATAKTLGVTVDRGTMSANDYNIALSKAIRATPDWQAKIEANTKAQQEQAAATAKTAKAAEDALGAWQRHQEKLTEAEKAYKKLQAEITTAQNHVEQFFQKFNGATWDFSQFEAFTDHGGNVRAEITKIDAEILKLTQKFGDDMPAAIRGMIIQLLLAKDGLSEFQKQAAELKLEAIFEGLDELGANMGKAMYGVGQQIPPIIASAGLARDEFNSMNEAIMNMHDPLSEIPQLIQDIANPTARLAAAYASLGKDSTASLEKAAEEAKSVYDEMVKDAESSTHDRLEAERRMWEAQIAADQAAGRTISKAAKDRLKEIEVELGISLSNQQKLWQDFQKQVGSILSGLQHSVVGNIFDQLFGRNNNDQLDKEAAKVRADLAERTAAWEQYQLDVAAQIELISQAHAEDLEKQIADLQASLEERRADWEQYQSDVKDKLEEFKIAQDEKLEEERASLLENLAERSEAWDKYQTDAAAKLDAFTAKQDEDLANRVGALRASLAERAGEEEKYQADAIRRLVEFAAANDAKLREQQEDLTRSLNQKRADYFEYVADVGEKLATLREVSAEKLEEEIANLKKSFEAKSKAYDEYVTDVRKKIARITEDVGEQIDDEGRDTRRGIDDKKRAYEREERDINDKINRELAKGRDANMAQVASWKQSLADKKEDLDLYVARAEEDLIEFTDDHKREAEQQTADLQAELARRAQAQAEAQVEFNNNVTEATTSSARELARQEKNIQDSLAERTRNWNEYQAEIARKMAEAQTAHDTAITNEQIKVNRSLTDRLADWDKYKADVAAKIAAAQKTHDDAIDAERAKVAASLTERATEWAKYQEEIARKLAAAQKKHDDAIDAEERKVAESLAARSREWDKYQADIAKKMEDAARKNAEDEAKEIARLRANLQDKLKDYEDYVKGIGEKLADLQSQHETLWGNIKTSALNAIQGIGEALTNLGVDFLADWLKEQGVIAGLKTAFTSLAKHISDGLGSVLSSIGRSIGGLFGIGGGGGEEGGGGGSSTPGGGLAGAIGGGGGEEGMGAPKSLLPPIFSAFMEIASWLQGRHMEADIAKMEVSMRELKTDFHGSRPSYR